MIAGGDGQIGAGGVDLGPGLLQLPRSAGGGGGGALVLGGSGGRGRGAGGGVGQVRQQIGHRAILAGLGEGAVCLDAASDQPQQGADQGERDRGRGRDRGPGRGFGVGGGVVIDKPGKRGVEGVCLAHGEGRSWVSGCEAR